MEPKRLVIIDGYSLLYRAFFATRYLSTSDGRPTNALFGFTQMLFTLIDKVKPNAILVALDTPGKTFRHAEYEAYKGTRRETADELKVQLGDSRKLIETLGIPSIELVGFEADDIVGTISKRAEENGYHTTIVTGDLDSLQLVDQCVSVMTPGKGMTETVTYDVDAVRERYGFGPEHVTDFKALKGDTSDNIPGVPGIGDKGAAELIQNFGTVESMLERFAELPAKYQKRIDGNQEQMAKSKWLATIVRDAPVEFDFAPYSLTRTQLDGAIRILESLEFRQVAKRAATILGRYCHSDSLLDEPLEEVVEVADEKIEVELSKLSDISALTSFVGEGLYSLYMSAPSAKVDLFDEERFAFVAVGDKVAEVRESDAIELLRRNPKMAVIHDAKPIYRYMTPSLMDAPGFDTMLAGYVLRSERSQYPLLGLIEAYLDVQPPTNGAEMAAALYRLQAPMCERLLKEDQTRVLEEVELPLIPILAEMEQLGICADRDQLREFSKTLEVTIEQVKSQIYEIAGQEFNIGSPKQLGEVLFEKLGIPGAQKTKTGYATGVEVLGTLTHPIAAEILNWRELTKLKSTYADALEKVIQPDGRIHTTYSQAVAATGRLSSNDPNLQNIPIRTELGRGIRKAFKAAPGYRLAGLDYSQIELRVLAHMCGELEAFQTHQDVHTVTAQQMFGLGTEPATKEQRRLAKMLNYAVLYGVSEYGLAQQLGGGFSIGEAKELIRLYNERFPTVKGFTEGIIADARSKGFTTTMMGRRRYFPDIHAAKVMERKYAERQAMNAPIQGTAADMLKLAMLKVRPMLVGTESRMLLNVHDELVFELKQGEESMVGELKGGMEAALPMNVPVEVDAKIGSDWQDMTPV